MPRHTPCFVALGMALLKCSPMASPAPHSRELIQTRAPDGSPQIATTTLLDASSSGEPDADAAVNAAPPPIPAADVPVEASAAVAPAYDPFLDPWSTVTPKEAKQEPEDRRPLGSPADMRTPEGASHGYYVVRHCPSYSLYDVIAVIGTGTKLVPRFGLPPPSSAPRSPQQSEKQFWAFASAVRQAVAVPSIHGVAAGGRCFGPSVEDAVIVYLHDWRQVDQAIRNAGTWLAANKWNGDVILWPQAVPKRGLSPK